MGNIEKAEPIKAIKELNLTAEPIDEPQYLKEHDSLYILSEEKLFIVNTKNYELKILEKADLLSIDKSNLPKDFNKTFSGISRDDSYVYITSGNYLFKINNSKKEYMHIELWEKNQVRPMLLKPILCEKNIYIISRNGYIYKVNKDNISAGCEHNWPIRESEGFVVINPIVDNKYLYFVQGNKIIAIALEKKPSVYFRASLSGIPAKYWLKSGAYSSEQKYLTINVEVNCTKNKGLFIHGDKIGIPLKTTFEYVSSRPAQGEELVNGFKTWNMVYVNKNKRQLTKASIEKNINIQNVISKENEEKITIRDLLLKENEEKIINQDLILKENEENVTIQNLFSKENGRNITIQNLVTFNTNLKKEIISYSEKVFTIEPERGKNAVKPNVEMGFMYSTISKPKDFINYIKGIPEPNQMLITPDGKYAYALSQDTLSLIDCNTNIVRETISVNDKNSMVITPDGRYLYISSLKANSPVIVVDTATNRVCEKIQFNGIVSTAEITSIAIAPDGKYIYVLDYKGRIYLIDVSSNTFKGIVGSVNDGSMDSWINVTFDNKYIFVHTKHNVWMLNINTFKVCDSINNLKYNITSNMAMTLDSKYAYLPCVEGLLILEISSGKINQDLVIGESYSGLAVYNNGRYIYGTTLNSRQLITITNGEMSKSFKHAPLEYSSQLLAITPDGKQLYLANKQKIDEKKDAITVFNIDTYNFFRKNVFMDNVNNIFKNKLYSRTIIDSDVSINTFYTFKDMNISLNENMKTECFIWAGPTLIQGLLTTGSEKNYLSPIEFLEEKVYKLYNNDISEKIEVVSLPIRISDKQTFIVGRYKNNRGYCVACYEVN